MHLVKPLNGGSGRGKEGRLRPCLRCSEGIRSEGTPSSPSCTCVRQGPVACAVGSWPDPCPSPPRTGSCPHVRWEAFCSDVFLQIACSHFAGMVIHRQKWRQLRDLVPCLLFSTQHCPRPVSSSPCLSAASENASPSMQCAWHQPPPFHVAVTEH